MSNQQSSCLFQCFLGLEAVQDNEGSFLALVHIESVGQDDHHEWDDESSPYYQNNVDNPAESCPGVVVSISDCGHRDDGQPERVREIWDVILPCFVNLSYRVAINSIQ